MYVHTVSHHFQNKILTFYQGRQSTLGTESHELHRRRRAALNPIFSKATARRLEPAMQRVQRDLLQRIDLYKKSGEAMPLTTAFKAATSEVITTLLFGQSEGDVLKDDFNRSFGAEFERSLEKGHLFAYLPGIAAAFDYLPFWLQGRVIPKLRTQVSVHEVGFFSLSFLSCWSWYGGR